MGLGYHNISLCFLIIVTQFKFLSCDPIDPLKDPKIEPPEMTPSLHRASWEGFLDPSWGLGTQGLRFRVQGLGAGKVGISIGAPVGRTGIHGASKP